MKRLDGDPTVGVDEMDAAAVFLVVGGDHLAKLGVEGATEGGKGDDGGVGVELADDIQQDLVFREIFDQTVAAVVGAVVDDDDGRLAGVGNGRTVKVLRIGQIGGGHQTHTRAGSADGAVAHHDGAHIHLLRGQPGVGGADVVLPDAVVLVDVGDGITGQGVIHVDQDALGDRVADKFDDGVLVIQILRSFLKKNVMHVAMFMMIKDN